MVHFFLPVTIKMRLSLLKTIEGITFDRNRMRFGNKLYRQIVGIPMGRNCAPLVADLILFC